MRNSSNFFFTKKWGGLVALILSFISPIATSAESLDLTRHAIILVPDGLQLAIPKSEDLDNVSFVFDSDGNIFDWESINEISLFHYALIKVFGIGIPKDPVFFAIKKIENIYKIFLEVPSPSPILIHSKSGASRINARLLESNQIILGDHRVMIQTHERIELIVFSKFSWEQVKKDLKIELMSESHPDDDFYTLKNLQSITVFGHSCSHALTLFDTVAPCYNFQQAIHSDFVYPSDSDISDISYIDNLRNKLRDGGYRGISAISLVAFIIACVIASRSALVIVIALSILLLFSPFGLIIFFATVILSLLGLQELFHTIRDVALRGCFFALALSPVFILIGSLAAFVSVVTMSVYFIITFALLKSAANSNIFQNKLNR